MNISLNQTVEHLKSLMASVKDYVFPDYSEIRVVGAGAGVPSPATTRKKCPRAFGSCALLTDLTGPSGRKLSMNTGAVKRAE